MKVIKESDFDTKNLNIHFDQHKNEYKYDLRFSNIKNDDDFKKKYNEIGDTLSRKKVGSSLSDSRYVGYIDKKGRSIKYDRAYNDFVVYVKNKSITLHKKSYKNYLKIRNRDFKSEFPYNDEVE